MNPGLVDLNHLVQDAENLAPLPASTARLAGLVTSRNWSLTEVAEVIRFDEALTGRLLRAANSALSGARREIATVEEAVMRLGSGTVLSFAVGGSVSRVMRSALPAFGLSEGELWCHSVATALAVDQMRAQVRGAITAEAFPAALLHDLGKLVLARHLEPEALSFLKQACEEDCLTAEEAELSILNVCHAELGALVTHSWNLPERISTGIRFHHAPLGADDEESRRLCHQIALAEAVATTIGAACGESSPRPAFTPALAGSLGISRDAFLELCVEVEARLEETLLFYA